MRVQPGEEPSVVDRVEAIDAIRDAFAVLGQPEVVARVNAPQLESLGGILSEISEIDGVIVSETLLEIPEGAV